MTKYYLIEKTTGIIKMICDNNKLQYDKSKFNIKKITTTKEEDNKIKQGYRLRYKRKLVLDEPADLKRKKTIETLQEEIDKADDIDKVKNILKQLI